MRALPFVKMEGAGNDYVFVDAFREPWSNAGAARLAVAISDRHFGVGSDGLIVLAPSERADCRMLMWNADGSSGAMCGNGLRCLAKLAYDLGHVRKTAMTVECGAGKRAVELQRDAGGVVIGARVEMGAVTVDDSPREVEIERDIVRYYRGDAGNPHAVVFVTDAIEEAPVERVGAAFQRLEAFPGGVNVDFVRIADGAIAQRTYERGTGETLACGTGATVAALAALKSGGVRGPRISVRVRGGTLVVEQQGSILVLEGPARRVFVGEFPIVHGAHHSAE